jgi:hypothetical protein
MQSQMQAQDIQREMQQVRAKLGADVRHLAQQARNTVDWRHYVRRYPWVCLGGAAAAGYLLVPRTRISSAVDAQKVRLNGRSSAVSSAAITSTIMAMVIRAFASAAVQRGIEALKGRANGTSSAILRRNADPAESFD